MIKITDYSGYGICSLCGAEKPSKQLQYTSPSRKATIPLCNKCAAELIRRENNNNDRINEQKLYGKDSKNNKSAKSDRTDNRNQQR